MDAFLIFAVVTSQSYTSKERNGTLKAMESESSLTLIESSRTVCAVLGWGRKSVTR